MFRVAFRADGGLNIGMGHIMRCLTLAEKFRRHGIEVYFISKLEEGIKKICEAPFEVLRLPSGCAEPDASIGECNELEKEAQEINRLVSQNEIDLLILDTYNVDKNYFLKLMKQAKKIGYIDDLNKFTYPVDILIHGSLVADYKPYEKYQEDEIVLAGLRYNLIRDEFKGLPERETKPSVATIMITTGASDQYNMSSRIINIILEDDELKSLEVNVVIGNSFKNKSELYKIAENNKNVNLHENVNYMSKIMLDSDIALSAGGSTLYELCACGTPTIAFVTADNQEFIVDKMHECGYLINLGFCNDIDNKKLTRTLKALMRDYMLRKELYSKGRNLVDGKGAQRVVERILEEFK